MPIIIIKGDIVFQIVNLEIFLRNFFSPEISKFFSKLIQNFKKKDYLIQLKFI